MSTAIHQIKFEKILNENRFSSIQNKIQLDNEMLSQACDKQQLHLWQ